MKVARTVLRGGKTERFYLSQQKVAGSNPATLILFTIQQEIKNFFVYKKKVLQFFNNKQKKCAIL